MIQGSKKGRCPPAQREKSLQNQTQWQKNLKNAIGWQSEAESRYQRHLKFDPPCGRVQLLLLKRNKNSVYRERGRRCRYFEKIQNADAGKYFHRPILKKPSRAQFVFGPKVKRTGTLATTLTVPNCVQGSILNGGKKETAGPFITAASFQEKSRTAGRIRQHMVHHVLT